MTNELSTNLTLSELGAIADHFASASVFTDYQRELASNTRARHKLDLRHFEQYLAEKGVSVASLYDDAQAWHGITWGLVSGFQKWMLQRGDAIGSINTRVTTVRKYAELAFMAGALTEQQYRTIHAVHNIRKKAAINIDKERPKRRMNTRKEQAPRLSKADRRRLKDDHADNDQGARDELLMCLLLDHGLRVSEIVDLAVGNIDLASGTMTFYRQKVQLTTTHRLSADTLGSLNNYKARGLMLDDPAEPLMYKSQKGGNRTTNHVTRNGLTKRVRYLANRILGIPNLACHDCRHSWATEYAKDHTVLELQEAGGWASLTMPRRYVEMLKIAHDGKVMD